VRDGDPTAGGGVRAGGGHFAAGSKLHEAEDFPRVSWNGEPAEAGDRELQAYTIVPPWAGWIAQTSFNSAPIDVQT